MSENATGSPIWATIGKLGAFVSLVIALVTLYGQINPEKADVLAICKSEAVLVRPGMKLVSVEQLNKLSNPKKPPSKVKVLTNLNVFDIDDIVNGPIRPETAFSCNVSNVGRQEAKDLVLDLPFVPRAARVGGKEVPKEAISEKSVNIGMLRPGVKTTIVVWGATLWYDEEGQSNYSLSYSGGVGKLMLPVLAYGWKASLVQFLNNVTRSPLTLVFVLLPLFFMIVQGTLRRASFWGFRSPDARKIIESPSMEDAEAVTPSNTDSPKPVLLASNVVVDRST
jgi:hypothetical protein